MGVKQPTAPRRIGRQLIEHRLQKLTFTLSARTNNVEMGVKAMEIKLNRPELMWPAIADDQGILFLPEPRTKELDHSASW